MAKGLKLILVIVSVLSLLLSPAELRIEARVLKSHGRREKGTSHLSRKPPSLHATLSRSSVKYGVVSEKKGYDKSSSVKHKMAGHDKSNSVKHTMDSRSTSPGHSPGVGHVSLIG
ncbi:hypothetical protein AMTRI_Chr04g249240 [Amborella trichopoda]|uniref:Uncharacterized protein n=1 Tax=Amborella trichopoda TaxID=13333 RepID=W1PCC4_AMBTC|nr:hypothetical protein AMTR_s00157p00029300 [Amborella trichopoda]